MSRQSFRSVQNSLPIKVLEEQITFHSKYASLNFDVQNESHTNAQNATLTKFSGLPGTAEHNKSGGGLALRRIYAFKRKNENNKTKFIICFYITRYSFSISYI